MKHKTAAYFIADAHLGVHLPAKPDREKKMVTFLRELQGEAAHLFILGDLFDFWIEYSHAIRPEYFPILHCLKLLTEHGTEIHYLAGNHDFMIGSFLNEAVGLSIHPESYTTHIQGKKVFMHHGDDLVSKDFGSTVVRGMLRNRFNQRLYKLLHPDVAVPIAAFFSRLSRRNMDSRTLGTLLTAHNRLARQYLDKDYDIVALAHTHEPLLHIWGEKYYCNPGNWTRRTTFAKMVDGAMTLWEYAPGGESQPIPPVSPVKNAAS